MTIPTRWRFTLLISGLLTTTPCSPSLTAQLPVGVADYQPIIYRICFPGIDFVLPKIPVIPVGCELVDCCPGCPGPGPIDWRIHVSGSPIAKMSLVFDNLSQDQVRDLKLQGNGRWIGANRLELTRGETWIRGLVDRRGAGVRPPVAAPQLNADALRRRSMGFGSNLDMQSPDTGELSLVVEQLSGPVVVSDYIVVFRFVHCLPVPRIPTDTIAVMNNASMDNSVVFLDGRMGTCVNDRIYRGSGKILVGNLQTNAACNSEVALFSDDDAFQLITPVTAWTDAPGDKLPADLTPDLWHAPVTVWIMLAGALPRAQSDLAFTNQAYNTNHVGVAFDPTYQDLSGNPAAVAAIGTPCYSGNFAGVQASGYYTPNRFNVYYVSFGITGYHCGGDHNMLVIGTFGRPETLAHELGHVFTLGHVESASGGVDYDGDGVPDLSNTNIMWGGGVGRTVFTEGQAFRMNLNPTSQLNVNGIRTIALTRSCGDATISVTCPWLGLDAVPN